MNLRRWQRASEKINFFSGRWTKSVHFGSKTGLKKRQKRAKNGHFCKIDRLLLQITQNYDDIKRKNAMYRWTLFGLFKSTCFRYHNTRQVATRQEHNNMDQRSARQTAMRQTPNEADSEPVERHLRGFLHGAAASSLFGQQPRPAGAASGSVHTAAVYPGVFSGGHCHDEQHHLSHQLQ